MANDNRAIEIHSPDDDETVVSVTTEETQNNVDPGLI